MSGKEFLKDKLWTLFLLIFALFTIEIFLILYDFAWMIKLYIPISILISWSIGIGIEFYQKNRYYQEVRKQLQDLDQKYLLAELVPDANFVEGKLQKEILQDCNKAMLEHVNYYRYLQEEYKEYIELWIHEIKIPIATCKLMLENQEEQISAEEDEFEKSRISEGNYFKRKKISKESIRREQLEELDKIENYIMQALFYARSNTVEKDYVIRKVNVKELVNDIIRKNKNRLLQEKIKINLHDLEVTINTDMKWMSFILQQIIQNAIQYQKPQLDKMEMPIENECDISVSQAAEVLENDEAPKKENLDIGTTQSDRNLEDFAIQTQSSASLENFAVQTQSSASLENFAVQTQLDKNLGNFAVQTQSDASLEIFAVQTQENVILSVKDTGMGIPENEVKQVFEKGFTGSNGRKRNKKSTGIGLYLCKKLCDKLGVSIVLESQENIGTEVKLIFPKNSYFEILN